MEFVISTGSGASTGSSIYYQLVPLVRWGTVDTELCKHAYQEGLFNGLKVELCGQERETICTWNDTELRLSIQVKVWNNVDTETLFKAGQELQAKVEKILNQLSDLESQLNAIQKARK